MDGRACFAEKKVNTIAGLANMSVPLTPSQENYLEWIYRIAQTGPVHVGDLAKKMGVRIPSVSRAVSTLDKAGLVVHRPYGTIELTQDGEDIGRAIVRRDECLTRLLVEVLGLDPKQADPEVHRIEHVLSDEVLARLEVLVEFATASDAWMRRLHLRLAGKRRPASETGGRIGAAQMHAGRASEKTNNREEQ